MLTAASTDYIQATIELFGAVITIVIAIMLLIITGNKKRSEKNLFALVILAGLSLVVDAGWYIFDGKTAPVAIVINKTCNFSIFMINPLMVAFLCGYLYHMIRENKGKVSKYLLNSIYSLSAISVLVVLSNLVYNWMYCIDSNNVYSRLDGWFVYAAINCVAILLIILMVTLNVRIIPKRQRRGLFVFLLAPFIGIALQTLIVGISFIQIGIVIGCVAVLINYVTGTISSEREKSGITEERKNFLLIECILMIMILCISASVISCIISVNLISNENSQQHSTALTYMVSDAVNMHISEAVDVSRVMSESHVVIDALSTENLRDSEIEENLLIYMNRIKDEYGFGTIFLASDITHEYYTDEGFSRIMDASRDGVDSWYSDFRNRNIAYALNVDEDKDNDMDLSVFINVAVKDDNGRILGVCGVATSLESFMNIISEYEEQYNLDISLINKEGLIQIDTDRDLIQSEYINVATLQPGSSHEIYYERNSLQAVMTKYMENLNWYLIVADNHPDKINVFSIVLPAIIVFVVGISLLLVFIVMFNKHNSKNMDDLKASRRLSETDGLTGLLNRYSLEEFEEEIEKNGMTLPLSVAMVDINGLKIVNDTLGHAAGDELIRGAATCMIKAFEKKGSIYRFGGDEFVVVMHCDETEATNLINKLKALCDGWRGSLVKELSVSIGVVSAENNPGLSFNELKEAADKLMYIDKNAYYEKTGRDRRTV